MIIDHGFDLGLLEGVHRGVIAEKSETSRVRSMQPRAS
jgi:hypothetical protein